jgi:predicted peroxiredoxin
MENFNISLNPEDFKKIATEFLTNKINKSLEKNEVFIEASLDNYFKKSLFEKKQNGFESALDWAIESIFREGIELAMEELKFKEKIAEKAKEILSDNDFITKLAESKVRTSLGLPLNP